MHEQAEPFGAASALFASPKQASAMPASRRRTSWTLRGAWPIWPRFLVSSSNSVFSIHVLFLSSLSAPSTRCAVAHILIRHGLPPLTTGKSEKPYSRLHRLGDGRCGRAPL